MTPELEAKIRGLAAVAHPSEGQIRSVLAGWERHFKRVGLPLDEQELDFDATMRARVSVGCVSIVADAPEVLHE